jgi:hypothetical protein
MPVKTEEEIDGIYQKNWFMGDTDGWPKIRTGDSCRPASVVMIRLLVTLYEDDWLPFYGVVKGQTREV